MPCSISIEIGWLAERCRSRTTRCNWSTVSPMSSPPSSDPETDVRGDADAVECDAVSVAALCKRRRPVRQFLEETGAIRAGEECLEERALIRAWASAVVQRAAISPTTPTRDSADLVDQMCLHDQTETKSHLRRRRRRQQNAPFKKGSSSARSKTCRKCIHRTASPPKRPTNETERGMSGEKRFPMTSVRRWSLLNARRRSRGRMRSGRLLKAV